MNALQNYKLFEIGDYSLKLYNLFFLYLMNKGLQRILPGSTENYLSLKFAILSCIF